MRHTHASVHFTSPQPFFNFCTRPWLPCPAHRPLHRFPMDRAADYDEQSEVLFLFTEDADDTQSQTDNQPHPTPHQPTTSPTTSATPQPPTTFSADQSFWAGVYTLHPPHALMGVLTDLHVHRFILHQHLDAHTALAETPIGHQPLTDALPQPIQRIIAIYHNNVQRAQHHTRLALNAIDTLARFPPAAYFTDPNLTPPDPQHTHSHAAPPYPSPPRPDRHQCHCPISLFCKRPSITGS